MEESSKISRNTAMLYIRTIITILVSLYTTRIILKTLGEENYGTYNVVGSIIIMFTFINTSMSAATSRFLAFELGKGKSGKFNETFNIALTIHIFIAIIILILGETIGLWLVNHKLVIPEGRLFAANIVYQFTVISTMFTIVQVPFTACIIAHEKMNVYAYFEIIKVGLNLSILYLLLIFNYDRLIVYGMLALCVYMCVFFLYYLYCVKKFDECRYKFIFDKEKYKPILSFSVWDLFGNMSVMAKIQGNNILINLFYGVTVNAASGITNSVTSGVNALSNSLGLASRPQIIKSYASNDIYTMSRLISNVARYSLILYSFIAIPILIETPYMLNLWLGDYPKYTVDFCRITIVFVTIGLINNPIVAAIHATGKVIKMAYFTGIVNIASLLIMYIGLAMVNTPIVSYIVSGIFSLINAMVYLRLLKIQIPEFRLYDFITNTFPKVVIIIVISLCVGLTFHFMMKLSFLRLAFVCMFTFFSSLILTYFFILDKERRSMIKQLLYSKFNIFKK